MRGGRSIWGKTWERSTKRLQKRQLFFLRQLSDSCGLLVARFAGVTRAIFLISGRLFHTGYAKTNWLSPTRGGKGGSLWDHCL
jgi:hypothetical protein